jgi:phosphodiesterase/alkaline phosphatase D-like protein
MKKYKLFNINVVTILFLSVFILVPGVNLNLNSQSTGSGSDSISYPTALSTISASPATGIGPTSATLNAFVNPNNEDATVSFEYSTDANFADEETPPPDTTAATPSPVTGNSFTAISANLTGLSPGTTYYFRAVATNASGTTNGNILSFTTSPPATVTTGIASPVTTTTAILNGIVNANNNSTTVTFEYGMTTSYGTTVTADQSPVTGQVDTAVSKTITGLIPDSTYHFRVVGDNALGTSYGDDMTFFTSAQTAPTVTTDDATFSVFPNNAALNGTVNANNADATVTFEYGTTTAYGTTVTADQSPVLGSVDTAVSKLITGLIPNTTYHYRVVATNGIGTTNGADMTFFNTTAPYAKTEAASNVTQTTATLNGTVNPKTLAEGSTVVTFEYGMTASYGTTVTAIESPIGGGYNQGVSFNLTGLIPNTTYHYRVIADNINGTGTGADMTFTTNSLPIVTTNTAAPVGTTTATLNGTVNANNDSTTVTFEYGTTTAYGTTVTADQSPVSGIIDTAVSKNITGLVNGTTYHYRVVGTNSSGTSSGADQTFTTGVNPPSVSTGAATSITTTSAIMNGTINANGLSTTVRFDWGLTTSYGVTSSATPGVVTGITNTPVTYNPTTLLPNTTYHYRVVAQNAGGIVYGADMSFTTNAAPTVTTNTATSTTTTGTVLNGMVNANNQSATVTFEFGTTTAYGTTVTADQSPVTGQVATPVSKAITGLTPNTTYHYRVVGTNASGTGYGADLTFTTAVGAPIVTTGSASPLVTGAILNGIVNAQNASTTVTFEYGTTVAYGSTVTADQSPVTGSNNTAVTVTLSGLSFNTTYHYRVVGSNVNGTVNGADMTFITTLNPSATTGAATNVLATAATVHGTANGNGGVWNVRFDYGTTIAYGSTMVATPNQTSGSADIPVSATLTGLTPNTTYHYRTTVYSGGFFYFGSDMTFTTLLGPAVTTNAATFVGSNTATVNGTVNANNASTTVTFEYGFDTSYGQSVTADQSPVTGNTNTAVSRTLGTLIPNTTYHYRVVGSNANGTVNGGDMTFTTSAIAPTVTTDAASGIGSTGATLNGTVNPNNDSTTVTFEYGTTTSYGTTVTADQSPVTGSSNMLVSKGITGLTTNTTYHYRVVGQNGAGTSNGVDMTFTTGTNTPTAATNAASGISTSGATLNGTVNANGASTTVTFEYGTSTAYGKTTTADQSPVTGSNDTAVTSTISGLIGSTTYHYRVVAQNAFGTTAGSDMTFLTAGSAPNAITDAATSVSSTTATLNGTVNAQNDSTTVTFEYGTTTAYGTTITATPSPVTGNTDTAVSSTLTGLTQGVTYHYRVVGQNTFGTATGADMTFTTGTITVPTVNTWMIMDITTSSATGGGNVIDEGMGTVTAKGLCWSTSSNPTIADSTTNDGSGLGAFSSSITGLVENTTYYVRAYATNSAGTGYGVQRSFTTNAETVTVTITNPTEGEQVSGTVTIIATTSSNPRVSDTIKAASKVEFYIDDIIIGTDASEPYQWDWDTTAESEGSHVIKVVAYNKINESSQDDIIVIVLNNEAKLSLNRTRMNFGAVPNSSGSSESFFDITYNQTLLINNIGGNTLSWNISDDASWLSSSPTSGTGAGVVSVGVDPTGLSTGTYTATLMVENSAAAGDSATVAVTLVVYNSGSTTGPFGFFSTPVNGSTVMSSIPVTGWVLDDIATSSVKIFRNSVVGDTITDSSGMVFVGNANLIDGARPDVETLYPGFPLNYQAGWGYMLLTNGLPGDGTYTLYAIATDVEGNEVTLGSKTITVDNASAVKPFGALDTPAQGGEAMGSSFVNFGWALTPQPNTIPTDGSTIKVWIDGVPLSGNPVYNQFRQDIADMFPGYNNTHGAVGYMIIDTTAYLNGVHTIAWSVQDDAGNTDGIGSRYFSILNTGSIQKTHSVSGFTSINNIIDRVAVEYTGPVTAQKGFGTDRNAGELPLNENNTAIMVIKELEPVQIQLAANLSGAKGFLMIDGRLAPLPIGSTFNEQTGTFSWLPGPGFVGIYHFTFIFRTYNGQFNKKSVDILIRPKFNVDKQRDLEKQTIRYNK